LDTRGGAARALQREKIVIAINDWDMEKFFGDVRWEGLRGEDAAWMREHCTDYLVDVRDKRLFRSSR
jgi:hypothetical protein